MSKFAYEGNKRSFFFGNKIRITVFFFVVPICASYVYPFVRHFFNTEKIKPANLALIKIE